MCCFVAAERYFSQGWLPPPQVRSGLGERGLVLSQTQRVCLNGMEAEEGVHDEHSPFLWWVCLSSLGGDSAVQGQRVNEGLLPTRQSVFPVLEAKCGEKASLAHAHTRHTALPVQGASLIRRLPGRSPLGGWRGRLEGGGMSQPRVFLPLGFPVTRPDPRGPCPLHLGGLTPALLPEKLVSSPVCSAEPGKENALWPEGRRAKPGVIQKGLPDASPSPGQGAPRTWPSELYMATGGREKVGDGKRLCFKDRGQRAGFLQLRASGPSFSF